MPERIETRLSELYVDNFERIMQGWPSYINSQRRELLETFSLHRLPCKHDEQYRHFDLREMFSAVHHLAPGGSGEVADTPPFSFEALRSIVVENGICSGQGLVRLHNGIIYGSLKMAAVEEPELVKKYYNSSIDTSSDMPAVLCGAFNEDGAFVNIPDGCVSQETIHIDIHYAASRDGEICFPRVLIIGGENSVSHIAITHSDMGFHPMVSCHVREVFTGGNAKMDITEAVYMRDDSILVGGNYSVNEERSVSSGTAVWLNGGATRINSVARLAGRDCETTLYGLYFANGKQLCDVNMQVRHEVPDCRSNEVIKGVVSGEATGAFTGMVYVAPDAQKTAALQQSRNLQLSDNARIYTEPQLEIYADDVKCSHGATVGQLDSEAVYYMRQRGISEQDARRLQLWGFVNDVILHCKNDEVCSRISALAEERIGKL